MDKMDPQVEVALAAHRAWQNAFEPSNDVSCVAKKIQKWLGKEKADVSVTLGTGLGAFGKDSLSAREIDYRSLGLPTSKMSSHASVLRFTPIGRHGVLLFSGRKHLYEDDATLDTTLLAVRAACAVGAKTQILTCATGSVNLDYRPGDLVFIKDHLNLMGVDPTKPFKSMANAYDQELRKEAQKEALWLFKKELAEGVLASKRGPSFETPAEIRMLRALGADMAGMSTVLETMVLRELGARVLGITLITNYGEGIVEKPVSHEDNSAEGAKATDRFSRLLSNIIVNLK